MFPKMDWIAESQTQTVYDHVTTFTAIHIQSQLSLQLTRYYLGAQQA